MKHYFSLLLVLCLLLSACGAPKEEAAAPTDPSDAPTESISATEAPEKETVPETEAPTEAPTEPPVVYRHPLTGEVLEAEWTIRPVASTINNVPEALPQSGVSKADFLIEIETEGAAPRCLAIFTDLSQLDALGSIRSARTYFNSLAISFDAPLVHVGGSKYAKAAWHDASGTRIENWEHLDLASFESYSYRDQDRLYQGYAWEHTLFSSGELLSKLLEKQGYATTDVVYDFGLQFDESPAISGETANTVVITYQGGKSTTMTFNPDTGLYEAAQYNKTWIDAADNNSVLSFRNVLILKSERTRPNGEHSFYELIGSGEGYFACDGQIVKILWTRPSLESPFSYTLEDGTPITLGVGTSFMSIITPKCNPSYS